MLWSKSSIGSSWVPNEASDAMQRKVLIPALIDADVKIGGGLAPATSPALAPTNQGSGLGTALVWYDHALTYRGTLTWDGRSNAAQLSADVFDTRTQQSIGHREVPAYGDPDAPGRNVFAAQIPVPGDSTTSGPHTHSVNLVFEVQPAGNWVFVRNCTRPGDCYDARP